MSVEVTIVCDGCAGVVAASSSAWRARRELSLAGGKTNLPGGKDLCPACAKAGRKPE